jgi:sulfur-carrier protein
VTVEVVLPGFLADLAGGEKHVQVEVGDGGTLAAYVDGEDVRFDQGVRTPVGDGATVHVMPSVAGG